MNALLPAHYMADAVPEKRTVDEEQLPPAAVQADEMLRRVEEEAKSEKEQMKPGEKAKEEQTSSSAGPAPKDQKAKSDSKRTRSHWEKKCGSARKGTHTEVNVVNITGSSNFHVGHEFTNHITFVNGNPVSKTKPSDSRTARPESNPNLELPPKLFRSMKEVTKEDCTHVSEHSTCGWEELGELLFFEERSRLEQYRAEMDKHTRKKAVQRILEEWRKISTSPLVGRLSAELLKLKEIDALKKLAKRHNLD